VQRLHIFLLETFSKLHQEFIVVGKGNFHLSFDFKLLFFQSSQQYFFFTAKEIDLDVGSIRVPTSPIFSAYHPNT